ncbi:MAG TPA: TIGR00303 family protein [Candidatus Obscuribacterales bacterium]
MGEFVRVVNDERGKMVSLLEFVRGQKGHGAFLLCVASSESSDHPGISNAGATPELRRHTPAIDAEALVMGEPANNAELPVSPTGVVSPVVITRACMRLANFGITVVDCGSFRAPEIPQAVKAGQRTAKCVSTGAAQDYGDVKQLFEAGMTIGQTLVANCDYIILSECVPAGTTTALGVLTALGFAAQGLVSSSLQQSNHDFRGRLIREGLERAKLDVDSVKKAPLNAVAAVGDPMQPFVAGLAIAASESVPVILGGGSQMLAVYALAQALLASDAERFPLDAERTLGVITTKWVVQDSSADTPALSKMVGAPFACSCPDFGRSRHPGLRSYEEGNVKEGVGAGAAMAIAHLAGGATPEAIVEEIDTCYDEMVLKKVSASK